jgi:hypothetical protein
MGPNGPKTRNPGKAGSLRFLSAMAAAAVLSVPDAARAAPGDELWRFYADFGVTVVNAGLDLSGNGGKDVLVGSEDDSLYLVEGKGAGAGSALWAAAFRASVSAAMFVPDLNGDGRPDVAGGDQLGLIQAVSGASGQPLWKFLTFGTVLGLALVPDVNGDGVDEVAAGSENDTVYVLSGKPDGLLGKVLWQFGFSGDKKGPPGGGGNPNAAASGKEAPAPPKDIPSGANSLAVLKGAGSSAFGLVVGTNVDTVYCLPTGGGVPKWKAGLPGDIWQVAAFPDQDGDGIYEVLAACGADMAYLLKGSTGETIWSHPVSMGAVSLAITPDMDGDGKPDALIGDGGGRVHCVPGAAQGVGVNAAWTYDFGDTSTILSIAPMGDLDKDGKPDCVVGTSSDLVALLNGKGGKTWSVNLGGEVTGVADLGDVDGNGTSDVGAGTLKGYASAHSGGGPASTFARAIRLAGPGGSRGSARSGFRREPGGPSGFLIRSPARAGEGFRADGRSVPGMPPPPAASPLPVTDK